MKNEDLEFFKNIIGEDNLNGGFGRQYNLFALSEGIKIAESLRNKELIVEFSKKDWDEQIKMVPNLDEGHSGNTFGLALRASMMYLPQLLANDRDIKIDSVIHQP